MRVCLSILDTPKKSSKTSRKPLRKSSAREMGIFPIPLKTFPKNHGAGCWGKMIANRTGSTIIRAVAVSAHNAAFACVVVPSRCQLFTRRKTRQLATAYTTMARTKPTIRAIKAVCCCMKNPDPATSWRASAVTSNVIATMPAKKSQRNQAHKNSVPSTPFRSGSTFLCRNVGFIHSMGRHGFLLSPISAKHWYRVPSLLYKKRRHDSRTLAAECCRTGCE